MEGEISERVERCETCRFWDGSLREEGDEDGDCKRFPPVIPPTVPHIRLARQIRGDDIYLHGLQPEIHCRDWCGEWRAKGGADVRTDPGLLRLIAAVEWGGPAPSPGELSELLPCLSFRELEVAKLRYGIGDGYVYTLEEVGRIFKITRERTRQIELKIGPKLKKLYESRRGS